MRVVAIVQARMNSTRLPGKVLRTFAGAPALRHVLERVRAARRVDEVVVATTPEPADDPIVDLARLLEVPAVRGSAHDVLDRYRQAAAEHRADLVVRVTSDCPAFDPFVLDAMLASWGDGDEYLNNVDPRTYPRGLDVEIARRDVLDAVAAQATERPDREHVFTYVYVRAPERFVRRNFARSGADLSRLRWTLDTAADLAFFDAAAAAYGAERFRSEYAHEPFAAFLEGRPEIEALNADVRQKALEPVAPRADEKG